jgi:Carboxypeptidase regulatory-like domain
MRLEKPMTKNLFTRLLPAAIVAIIAMSAGIFAQGGTGSISGVVADSTGAVVKGATVTLTSKATNQSQTATTSDDGLYNFVLLQPGDYTIKTTAGSFAPVSLEAKVQVGRTTDANVTLGVAGVSAVVEVTAEGIQTTSNNFDAVQSAAAIENLPINGRRFQDFVTLTPTAQVDPSRGQISLSGQRGINSSVNVDGVDYNQPFFGGIRGGERSNSSFTLPQEAIREFQVVAAGYSAEFGRSSGGIVNAVTKSGTNDFRGSLFYLLRPQKLARANKFAEELGIQRLNALGIDATLAPTQQQFGGSVGGPIVKDKFFYFGSVEVQRFNAPRQVLFQNLVGTTTANLTLPSQLEAFNFYRGLEVPYDQTNNSIALLGKIDWNLNDSNRFNIRYNHSRNKALNAVSTGETALDPTTTNSLSTNGTEENRNNIVVAQFISTLSSNWINEFRGQFAREVRPRSANAVVSNLTTSIGVYGTRNFLPTTQFDRRIQVGDNVTYINGSHSFKFGGEFSDILADQKFGFNQTGVYTFAGLTSTLGTGTIGTGILDSVGTGQTATYRGRFDTTTARYNLQIGNLAAAYTVKELSFFGQDAWRIRPNFTLNVGLRYEKQYNPDAEANNSPVINLIKATTFPILGKAIDPTVIPDSQNQWGPRLGFAWDPKGDGRTVIRAYSGVYYARTPLLVLAGPFNNFRNPAGDLSVTLGSPAFSATGFNQATFDAQNPGYVTIMGGTGFTPNTVYRQFAILGINLNSSSLGSLPKLTTAQLQSITNALLAATTNPPTNLGVFQGANLTGMTSDFKNPQSFQFGGGVEHEMWKGITLGIDFSQVATSYLQRNRDINLPAQTGLDPVTGRVLVNRATRPLTNLGTIQLRDSSAHSVYRALTFRMNLTKSWVRVNTFYTLSRSQSDDDNERDAGGVLYANPYNLLGEYYNSRLDRRHQFVANPLFYLPAGIEVSSAIRVRSGSPVNSIVGSDLNGDGNTTERPIIVPGVELPRNYFTNRPLFDLDLRVQRAIRLGETRRLTLSAEFFNLFNLSNVQFSGSATTNYCNNTASNCGLAGITNINFLNPIQQTTTASNFGRLNLAGLNPGSQVFQMQLGARFYF